MDMNDYIVTDFNFESIGQFDIGRVSRFGSKSQPRSVKGKFLRGPVPLEWLRRAAMLPGKSLAVGIVLWFEAGCDKCLTVRITNAVGKKLGIERRSKDRGLRNLEEAGLVEVDRHRGRCPVVTILLPEDANVISGR